MASRSRLTAEERAEQDKLAARKDRDHDRYVQRTYGLNEGEYARRLAEQDGRCAICMNRARTRRLAVDHDHQTNEVRGLLCYRCNEFMGQWEFNPIAAHNASVYLAKIAATYGEIYAPTQPHQRTIKLPARRLN